MALKNKVMQKALSKGLNYTDFNVENIRKMTDTDIVILLETLLEEFDSLEARVGKLE